ncbi:Gfo/Idh/MocA family oxidoreductase [Fontisphaera persica]|uniref:Gfo/Idh/MocA family protein n=1 Tax=Fontisphaera persica TaxID=2974023 RepID=UPI0024BFB0B2|nr:Gfo/Idh/MocA family oxidoreductase [Fontisphaera persica]WCJ60404.1 Gfo/Idh/MocA family oxidoreductase [Fontisphaera persica]
MKRRHFLRNSAMAAAALTIIPRHVLGGAGQVSPNEKMTVALIGCGTQGLREMAHELKQPELQYVAACDPNQDSQDYVDWSKDGIRSMVAEAIGQPNWRKERPGIPGGREVAKVMIEGAYAQQRQRSQFRGVKTYADFRELLAKASDVDLVKIMTPDHLHAVIAVMAMKKGRKVVTHKPLANRVSEGRWVIETARQTGAATHFLPANAGDAVRRLAHWTRQGVIGRLKEIHNWSNRPVWPQYATLPTDRPPVPKGFDWDLWLGPSLPRPYHPHYTHAVFRGWYEFGGGPIADMGHYSLWRVFQELNLDAPILVESTPSHVCEVRDQVSVVIANDYSFPVASTVRFKFPARGDRPEINLYWYDGGMRPPTPPELEKEGGELPPEGMMWVGDERIIIAGFLGQNPRVLPAPKQDLDALRPPPREAPNWTHALRLGQKTDGDFLLAGPITEAFNLAAVSLRLGGKRLLWDAARGAITNRPEANRYLTREYRKGWEPQFI